jgi:RNA polymerase sigma-70 factor, ECF subfamily
MTTLFSQSIARWRQSPDEDEDAGPIADAQKNPAAFSVLYDHYVQPIYRYLYYRTSSAPEAEDLTSQTFLSALEALPHYQHRGSFAAWLFRIARGKVIDHFRRQQQLPLEESIPSETPDPLAQVAQKDELARLMVLVRSLAEDEQELIRLRYSAGLPFAQIAVLLDSNENTVKKSLYRIMARLESRLSSQMEDPHHA